MSELKDLISDSIIGALVPGSIAYGMFKRDRETYRTKKGNLNLGLLEKIGLGTRSLVFLASDLFSYALYGPVAESVLRLNVGIEASFGIEPYLENPIGAGFIIMGARTLMNFGSKREDYLAVKPPSTEID